MRTCVIHIVVTVLGYVCPHEHLCVNKMYRRCTKMVMDHKPLIAVLDCIVLWQLCSI